jgi:hypothetical protein
MQVAGLARDTMRAAAQAGLRPDVELGWSLSIGSSP